MTQNHPKVSLKERLSLSYRLKPGNPANPPSASLAGLLKYKPAKTPNSILKAYNFSPKKQNDKRRKLDGTHVPIEVDSSPDGI